MKKIALILCSLFLLTACNSNTTNNANQKNSSDNIASQNKKETVNQGQSSSNTNDQNVGKTVSVPNFGQLTVVKQSDPINEEHTTGPFKLVLKSISVLELKPDDQMKEYLGDDIQSAIFVEMKASNTSEDTNSFYPDQSTLVVNQKEQLNADILGSEQIGGEFIGPVEKEGVVVFFSKTPAQEINDFKIKIDPGHDSAFNPVGEELMLQYHYN